MDLAFSIPKRRFQLSGVLAKAAESLLGIIESNETSSHQVLLHRVLSNAQSDYHRLKDSYSYFPRSGLLLDEFVSKFVDCNLPLDTLREEVHEIVHSPVFDWLRNETRTICREILLQQAKEYGRRSDECNEELENFLAQSLSSAVLDEDEKERGTIVRKTEKRSRISPFKARTSEAKRKKMDSDNANPHLRPEGTTQISLPEASHDIFKKIQTVYTQRLYQFFQCTEEQIASSDDSTLSSFHILQ